MSERIASCSCGRLAAVAAGEPVRISLCHCLECKRRTGSAFAMQATWPEDSVTIRGESREYERFGEDGGNWARESFCPNCGVRAFYRIELRPGLVSIPVGAFADPDFPPPSFEVYRERAQRGLTLTIDPPPTQE